PAMKDVRSMIGPIAATDGNAILFRDAIGLGEQAREIFPPLAEDCLLGIATVREGRHVSQEPLQGVSGRHSISFLRVKPSVRPSRTRAPPIAPGAWPRAIPFP